MATLPPLPDTSVSNPPRTVQQYRSFIGIFVGVGIALVATIILVRTDHANLWFPLLSAIAFPALAISPFVIMRLKMPVWSRVIVIGLIGLVIIPFLGIRETDYIELAVQMAIFATLALGLNIVVGFAGLLDLGYIAFFAVGAYTWGIFASRQADTIFRPSNALAAPETFYLFIFAGIAGAAV